MKECIILESQTVRYNTDVTDKPWRTLFSPNCRKSRDLMLSIYGQGFLPGLRAQLISVSYPGRKASDHMTRKRLTKEKY